MQFEDQDTTIKNSLRYTVRVRALRLEIGSLIETRIY